jgi:hypothetical protein
MAHQHGNLSQAIVDAAYKAVSDNEAGGEHRIAILLYESQQKTDDVLLKILDKLNGNGRRSKKDKAKAAAVPVGGGMGFMAIVFELMRLGG